MSTLFNDVLGFDSDTILPATIPLLSGISSATSAGVPDAVTVPANIALPLSSTDAISFQVLPPCSDLMMKLPEVLFIRYKLLLSDDKPKAHDTTHIEEAVLVLFPLPPMRGPENVPFAAVILPVKVAEDEEVIAPDAAMVRPIEVLLLFPNSTPADLVEFAPLGLVVIIADVGGVPDVPVEPVSVKEVEFVE